MFSSFQVLTSRGQILSRDWLQTGCDVTTYIWDEDKQRNRLQQMNVNLNMKSISSCQTAHVHYPAHSSDETINKRHF